MQVFNFRLDYLRIGVATNVFSIHWVQITHEDNKASYTRATNKKGEADKISMKYDGMENIVPDLDKDYAKGTSYYIKPFY